MNLEQKMAVAIEEAKLSLDNNELPVGAAIFLGNEIISKAFSSGEGSRVYLQHAEMKALLEADLKGYSVQDRKKMQLFVTLEPCMMCLGAAMSFFVGEIYYALEAPMDGAVEFAQNFWQKDSKEIPSYNLPKISKGILRDESLKLFAQFVESNDSGPMYEFAKSLLDM